MSYGEFVPAIGEQFNSCWRRNIIYKGKDGKEYDMKFFTHKSHFNHNIGLQSCYYGMEGVGRDCKTNGTTYREMVGFPKDKILVGDSVDKEETILIRKIGQTFYEHKKIGDFIDNFINNKLISDTGHEFNNNINYEVLSIDNNMKVCWKKINQVIRHKINKQSIELETIGGRRIKITSDHSLIQLQDINTFKAITGAEVIKNDYIISYDKIRLDDTNIDKYEDFDIGEIELKIMGYIIGDGHLTKTQKVIGISGIQEKGLLNLWQKFAKKYNVNIGYSKNKFDSTIASKKLYLILYNLGLNGDSYTKKIPDWILNLPKEKLGYFLNGYFSADGTILITEKNTISNIGIGSASKKLIQDTKLALDKLGIKYNNGYTKEHPTIINNKEYISKESWNLSIYDKESIKLFRQYINFTHELKQKKLINARLPEKSKIQQANLPCNIVKDFCKFGNQDFINKNRIHHNIAKSDIGCFRIKNIRLSNFNDEYVYDLSVEDTEKFICSGVLVHNSGGFQMASFKIRGDVCNLKPIDSLRWQEANCDIAMNLDVPPTLGKITTYEAFIASLNESVENFRLFEKERKNYNMKLYNVLHGETYELMEIWYNKVKDFKFDGFAVGMKPPFDPMIQAMGFLYLWEKGELDKDNCFGVHFFGTSGKHVVPTIAYIASKLKKQRVTYDSSSYNIGSIYRTYYLPFDIGPHLSFGDKFTRINPNLKELPCHCPVCKTITDVDELNTTDIYAGTLISLHNMWQYVQYNDIVNRLVNDRDLFLGYLNDIHISEKTLKSIEFIDFVMEKGHTLKDAVKHFGRWLLPQELDKTKQVGIYHF